MKKFQEKEKSTLEKGSITMLHHLQTNKEGETNLRKFVPIEITANLACNFRLLISVCWPISLCWPIFFLIFTETNIIMLAETYWQLHLKHLELDFLLQEQEKIQQKMPAH